MGSTQALGSHSLALGTSTEHRMELTRAAQHAENDQMDDDGKLKISSEIKPSLKPYTYHESRTYLTYLTDLATFISSRVESDVVLAIPQLSYPELKNRDQLVEKMAEKGFKTCHWTRERLTTEQVQVAMEEMAVLHATGLVYRMNLKEDICKVYPWLKEDMYTSYIAKELMAKYLDSYLHYLSHYPNSDKTVTKLRGLKTNIFELLSTLRRPTDVLGTRFLTVCHGDLWMGSLMYKDSENTGLECALLDFHSSSYLSPATDLVNLLLTSCEADSVTKNWKVLVKQYYDKFNSTVSKFGIVLKHLGSSYGHFVQEVDRALAGQLLCVLVVTPILVMFGPKHRDSTRQRTSSERQTSVRHIIQMMAITEEGSDEDDFVHEELTFAKEWLFIHNDEKLRSSIENLLFIADKLGVVEKLEMYSQGLGNKR